LLAAPRVAVAAASNAASPTLPATSTRFVRLSLESAASRIRAA